MYTCKYIGMRDISCNYMIIYIEIYYLINIVVTYIYLKCVLSELKSKSWVDKLNRKIHRILRLKSHFFYNYWYSSNSFGGKGNCGKENGNYSLWGAVLFSNFASISYVLLAAPFVYFSITFLVYRSIFLDLLYFEAHNII